MDLKSSSRTGKLTLGRVIAILASVTLLPSGQSSSDIFCYLDPSCDPWSPLWAGACKEGSHQSPINLPYDIINKSIAKAKSLPADLNFNGNYSSEGFYIQDNGHTVQVSFSADLTSSAQLTGHNLDNPYTLAQLHFHWGENNSIGSEHLLNGSHHPMEVHLVHYSTKYASFSQAVAAKDPKSLAVVAVFLTSGAETDAVAPFDRIAANLPLNFQETPTRIPVGLDLSDLLPKVGQRFYRYMGSLTTPNCTEDVIWTVVTEPIVVKPSGLQKFRNVRNHESFLLGENFRPAQPLNGRLLEFMHKDGGAEVMFNGSSGFQIYNLNLILGLSILLRIFY